MKIKIENMKIKQDLTKQCVLDFACEKMRIKHDLVEDFQILKKSIDARNKNDIFYNYSVLIDVKENNVSKSFLKNKNFKIVTENVFERLPKVNVMKKISYKPVIIGAGPAGLFCALTLIENGIKPIIIEQGRKVDERTKDVELFQKERVLLESSNVQFGEGGAGTFSDGKLTTNLNSPLCRAVINQFIKFGAPEEISYVNKPHIGTDNLVNIIANIRNYITDNGGKFLFETQATDVVLTDGKIKSVVCCDLSQPKDAQPIEIATDCLILAIGHSSRRLFKILNEKNAYMEPKNFSVGLRIEHKQKMINEAQYGKTTKLNLPPAEYKLVYHGKEHSCYTFCMCPGGEVIASSSEKNTIVTNGMSKFARNGENANSAILVNITPKDLLSSEMDKLLREHFGQKLEKNSLIGMYFQEMLEEKAFCLGGNNYNAPVQKVGDFLENKKTEFWGEIKPTYKPGVTMSNLREILPEFIANTLEEGIMYFDKKIAGFANPDAILTGVETRSSSPVTIKRNEEYMASINGMYPCGEGAGYAGGIMSAAIDGIKVATAILEHY